MVTNIFMAATVVVAIFIGMFIYRLGLSDGLNVKKDKPISNLNPVKKVYETFKDIKDDSEIDKIEKEFNDNIDEILKYDGKPKG